MHQKERIKQAWRDAGLYDSGDEKLLAFLELLDGPRGCWPELAEECRRNYPAYKARLVNPILDTADKLLRLNLIRIAMPEHRDEVDLLRRFIRKSDPHRDAIELKALALKGVARLTKDIRLKENLPAELRVIVGSAPAARPAARQRARKERVE
jgi:hypothetical protein